MYSFKNRYPSRQRKHDCDQILLKYPDRIPILCEKNPYSKNAPDIDKHKYLVNYDLTLGQFMLVIRKNQLIMLE